MGLTPREGSIPSSGTKSRTISRSTSPRRPPPWIDLSDSSAYAVFRFRKARTFPRRAVDATGSASRPSAAGCCESRIRHGAVSRDGKITDLESKLTEVTAKLAAFDGVDLEALKARPDAAPCRGAETQLKAFDGIDPAEHRAVKDKLATSQATADSAVFRSKVSDASARAHCASR